MNKPAKETYGALIERIGKILEEGRRQVAYAVNYHMVISYWEIGRYIVEFEQHGESRAIYGEELLEKLSKDLTLKYGKGMNRSNLTYMRQCYLEYEKVQTVSGKFILQQRNTKSVTVSHKLDQKSETVSHILSWSHYYEFLKIQDRSERAFYEKQCFAESWSVRELRRQINSGLYFRIALSRDKAKIIELSKNGHKQSKPEDIIKSPYVFEFLGLPEKDLYLESDLEKALVDKLQDFLLELGKGFAFMGRQYRITLANKHYRVDLVFYHRILKCFVLIDLKRGEVNHQDIGQMNMYLNYFEKEQNVEGDNKPVGVVLAATKDDILVEYAMGNLNSQIFISTYQLYLPDKDELKRELVKILDR